MIFKTTDSMVCLGYYRIEANLFALIDEYQVCLQERGHWPKFQANLFGLTMPEYWRYLRDTYNGTLAGKQGGYLTVYFKNKKDCDNIVKELNNRWNKIIERS